MVILLALLLFDELCYVPASKAGAELPFDVITIAYNRNSLIVTTPLPFVNWTEVLGSELLTGATLDRLTHRCQILETTGEFTAGRTPSGGGDKEVAHSCLSTISSNRHSGGPRRRAVDTTSCPDIRHQRELGAKGCPTAS